MKKYNKDTETYCFRCTVSKQVAKSNFMLTHCVSLLKGSRGRTFKRHKWKWMPTVYA